MGTRLLVRMRRRRSSPRLAPVVEIGSRTVQLRDSWKGIQRTSCPESLASVSSPPQPDSGGAKYRAEVKMAVRSFVSFHIYTRNCPTKPATAQSRLPRILPRRKRASCVVHMETVSHQSRYIPISQSRYFDFSYESNLRYHRCRTPARLAWRGVRIARHARSYGVSSPRMRRGRGDSVLITPSTLDRVTAAAPTSVTITIHHAL